MSDLEIGYAAGLFDGEGSIKLNKNGNKKAKVRHPVVSIHSTTFELLQFMYGRYGGYLYKMKPRENKKQTWKWEAHNQKAVNCVREMMPLLREPEKRRRAEIILEFSEADTEKKLELTELFFQNSEYKITTNPLVSQE